MAQQIINANNGAPLGGPNMGLGTDFGDSWLTTVTKLNAMFAELYGGASTIAGAKTYTGSQTVDVASANAFDVGPNGATNPTLQIDTSTASAATGLKIKSAAAGAAIALSVVSSAANENLTLDAKGTGTLIIGGVSSGQISLGRGSSTMPIYSGAVTALGTTQNSTPTAAQLLGGYVTQTGETGAGTVTLPTGTLMSTAVSAVTVGDNFQCVFANLGGGENLVITAATGMAVVGNGTVPSGKNALLNFVNTGTNTWNCYVRVSA